MAAVMIGIDPHKASHTAVAISAAVCEALGELRVRACAAQASRLLAWVAPRPRGPGRWKVPVAWATCWPSSCWPQAEPAGAWGPPALAVSG
jgi:hypothetical protein